MRDILPILDSWHAQGKQMALATVVQTWRSSPRGAGAKMAVTVDGQFAGSVSGGCVESAVIQAAQDVIATGQPRLLHFGVTDETAWGVGLACGGSLDVFVQPFPADLFPRLREAWMAEEARSVHVTVIRGPAAGQGFLVAEDGSVPPGDWGANRVQHLAHEALLYGTPRRAALDDDTEIFVEPISPPVTLVLVGGVHITIALASLAKTIGYRTVVVDPRGVWGSEERFPHVDQLIQAWPQQAFTQVKITRSTAVVMLTHDEKIDDPALKVALNSPAFYVGALGSKKTNARRRERLLNEGLSESQLSRLHAPVGLDIRAETPEEIALAILAEVVAMHRQREQHVWEADPHPIQS